MAIEKATTYTGSIEAFPMFRRFEIEKEFEEKIKDNKRWQEPTGGLLVTAIFEVAGEEQQVSATVAAWQMASMTMQQLLTVAAAKLATQLGV